MQTNTNMNTNRKFYWIDFSKKSFYSLKLIANCKKKIEAFRFPMFSV